MGLRNCSPSAAARTVTRQSESATRRARPRGGTCVDFNRPRGPAGSAAADAPASTAWSARRALDVTRGRAFTVSPRPRSLTWRASASGAAGGDALPMAAAARSRGEAAAATGRERTPPAERAGRGDRGGLPERVATAVFLHLRSRRRCARPQGRRSLSREPAWVTAKTVPLATSVDGRRPAPVLFRGVQISARRDLPARPSRASTSRRAAAVRCHAAAQRTRRRPPSRSRRAQRSRSSSTAGSGCRMRAPACAVARRRVAPGALCSRRSRPRQPSRGDRGTTMLQLELRDPVEPGLGRPHQLAWCWRGAVPATAALVGGPGLHSVMNVTVTSIRLVA